jgi:hypothetical protein
VEKRVRPIFRVAVGGKGRADKLTFKLLKTISTNRPRVFRIKE